MTATVDSKPWDFSHVLDFVNSLSTKPDSSSLYDRSNESRISSEDHREKRDDEADQMESGTGSQSLGDFSKLWKHLGTPTTLLSNASAVNVQTGRAQGADTLDLPTVNGESIDCTVRPDDLSKKSKAEKKAEKRLARALRQLQDSSEEQVEDTASDGSTLPDTPVLTKAQRKKKNRKARFQKEADLAMARTAQKASKIGSESETDHLPPKLLPRADATGATTTQKHSYSLRPRDSSGKAITASPAPQHGTQTAVSKPYLEDLENNRTRSAAREIPPRLQNADTSNYDAIYSRSAQHLRSPTMYSGNAVRQVPPTARPVSDSETRSISTSQHQIQLANTPAPTLRFLPSTVQPSSHSLIRPGPIPHHLLPTLNSARPKTAHAIQPMVVRSGEDRHWALLMKLLGDFYADRKHLLSPMNLTTHNNDPKGIHVFVDASNIFIGFKDQLKRARGISLRTETPAVDLSFDALALLMERRRPVAKRVLVGSTPHLPAFDKAKSVGYECSILEKVYKARQLTERQVFFKELDQAEHSRKRAKAPPANNVATLNGGYISGGGSGSETGAAQYARAAMIEQGVDEILHLKMLESVIDADEPSTIVLATGDAAQAEYSDGFMATAKRALKKGWSVELVSWSKNISAMYTKREWVNTWEGRFKIVYLDDYSEELLDM